MLRQTQSLRLRAQESQEGGEYHKDSVCGRLRPQLTVRTARCRHTHIHCTAQKKKKRYSQRSVFYLRCRYHVAIMRDSDLKLLSKINYGNSRGNLTRMFSGVFKRIHVSDILFIGNTILVPD